MVSLWYLFSLTYQRDCNNYWKKKKKKKSYVNNTKAGSVANTIKCNDDSRDPPHKHSVQVEATVEPTSNKPKVSNVANRLNHYFKSTNREAVQEAFLYFPKYQT